MLYSSNSPLDPNQKSYKIYLEILRSNKTWSSWRTKDSLKSFRTCMAISTCCGICSLRTGTIVIAILNLIFGVLSLIISSIILVDIFSPYYKIELKSLGGGLISYILMVLTLALVLLIGAIKRNINFVFPYVYLSFGNILLSIGGFISIIINFCTQPYMPGIAIFLIFFIIGILLSLQIYFWLIIFFYYKQLIEEGRQSNITQNNLLENELSC
ncbi:lysosomal-associated transmembrane protein 4A-like [Chelonus insularis]|uniref:lysosomal-associated transmembrane protein 4A-like n=1 Tax=Chelonus insularis TaxID=460826 RepID=UPI00158B48F9|nr:lysosomal-associated transmembrane protein 4A-like [Chelonus insularis]